MEIKIKLLTDTAKIPTKAHPTDACFDLYLDEPNATYSDFTADGGFEQNVKGVKIPPGVTVKLHSGIATEIPEGYFCAIYPRSGLGIKQNLRLPNGTGIIDSAYRAEWVIALYNDSDKSQIIHHGDRVAQFAVLPVLDITLVNCEELSKTDRNLGGLGSSGK